MHHTKDKGDLGVLKASVDLHIKGYIVCTPLTEHAPFDLIAYKSGKCLRIQVKYRTVKNGSINIRFQNSWADKNGSHTKDIDKNECDLFCVYCADNDTCYYLNPKDYNRHVNLRIEETKALNPSYINFAKDFLEIPASLYIS